MLREVCLRWGLRLRYGLFRRVAPHSAGISFICRHSPILLSAVDIKKTEKTHEDAVPSRGQTETNPMARASTVALAGRRTSHARSRDETRGRHLQMTESQGNYRPAVLVMLVLLVDAVHVYSRSSCNRCCIASKMPPPCPFPIVLPRYFFKSRFTPVAPDSLTRYLHR